jgi:hypothetical protein
MSNADRTREAKPACPFDGATVRDSNGQCHCRNVLYREWQKDLSIKDDMTLIFNKALLDGDSIETALAAVRAEFPHLVRTRKINATPTPAAPPAVVETPAVVEDEKKPTTAEIIKDEVAVEKAEKPRYVLAFVPSGQTTEYARKDAAIKAGVRSGGEWTVSYKGKKVAQSDELL